MPDTQSTPSSVGPWRVADNSVWSTGTAPLIQPDRLDVLVHLLAFEQLAGTSTTGHERTYRGVDWVARSEAFTEADNEVGVASLAAELLTCPECELGVSFASGGQLVRGAAIAAAALYSGRPISRIDAVDKVIDRSYAALMSAGWSTSELSELLAAWCRIEPQAAAILIDLDSPEAASAEHELNCRYPILASSIDHVSADDLSDFMTPASGSVRVIYLQADGVVFAQVLNEYQEAIVLARRGPDAGAVLNALSAPDRLQSTSPDHDRRLRRLRRVERRNDLLARTLGR